MSRDLFGDLMGATEQEKKEEKRVRNRKLRENVPSEIGSRSGDLQIVNLLVDTSRRSVGVDKSMGKRLFVKRPMAVGYRVKNVSEESVSMRRRIYRATEGADRYECQDTDFVLKPGESVDLSKYDAARLFGQVQFGFTARNGYFTGSKGLENSTDLEEYYATRYFVPTTPLSDRDTIIVNSQVGLKDVSDEYLSVFAFLMEGKKPKRQKVSSRCQMESLALAAYLKEHDGVPEAKAGSVEEDEPFKLEEALSGLGEGLEEPDAYDELEETEEGEE